MPGGISFLIYITEIKEEFIRRNKYNRTIISLVLFGEQQSKDILREGTTTNHARLCRLLRDGESREFERNL